MKYEDIEVGKTYLADGHTEVVKYKEDTTKEVVTLNQEVGILIYDQDQYERWTEKNNLPDVGLVVTNNGSIIYRTGNKSGYGFTCGIYETSDFWTFKSRPHDWRKATQEEEQKFIELLKKEAERRGLGEDSKIKECLFGTPINSTNKNNFQPDFTLREAWNKNGCIFQYGEWAEPLKNDLSEQIDELKEKAKELNLKITVTIE